MSIRHLFAIFLAHKRLVFTGMVLGLALSVLWVAISKPTYTARAQVLATVRSPAAASATNAQPELAPDYLDTQVDIIRSDRVAQRAAERLVPLPAKGAFMPETRADAPGTPEQRLADSLKKGLNVTPSNTSRVISIEFKSDNPNRAAAVANAFARAYQDVSLDLEVSPARQSLGWFSKAADNLRERLANAQQRLSTRRQQLGVTSDLDQVDAEDARLTGLSQALATAQAGQAAAASKTLGSALPDSMDSPVIQGLQSSIAQLESQRRQLATRAGPNNIDMREIVGQIAALHQDEAQQRATIAQSAKAAAVQANGNVQDLTAQVTAQKIRVMQSRAARGEVSTLQQEVDSLHKSYDDLFARQSQASLLGSGEQTNVTILSTATAPLHRTGVPLIFKIVAGCLLGTLAGIILAIAREFSDQRVRNADDLERWIGIPNLGVIHMLTPEGPRLLATPTRYLPEPARS